MTWVLALSLILAAVLVETHSGANQPLVAVFVFAGFIATRLSLRQFLGLILVIGITLMVPLLLGASGSEQLWRRLIGLSCLSIMTVYQCFASLRVTEQLPLPSATDADSTEHTEFTSQIPTMEKRRLG